MTRFEQSAAGRAALWSACRERCQVKILAFEAIAAEHREATIATARHQLAARLPERIAERREGLRAEREALRGTLRTYPERAAALGRQGAAAGNAWIVDADQESPCRCIYGCDTFRCSRCLRLPYRVMPRGL